jgi:phage shock protein A
LELLQKVRRGVADVATSRKRLELQGKQLQQTWTKLEQQAREALAASREDLAREAIARRATVERQLADLERQHTQLQAEEQKLTLASQRLQSQVEAFRTRKETIKASYSAAEAQTKIGEAISGISEEMGDVGLAVERAEQKSLEMQARAGAIDELMASGALEDLSRPTDAIEAELDQMAIEASVESELERLRREVEAGEPPKPLQARAQERER